MRCLRMRAVLPLCALILLGACGCSGAGSRIEPEAAQAAETAEAESPDPFKVLKSMSDYLRKQPQFHVQAIDTTDGVSETGAKVQVSTRRSILVSRPNRIRVESAGDTLNRKVWYDGKMLTMYETDKRVYAKVKAPETIDKMLDYHSAYEVRTEGRVLAKATPRTVDHPQTCVHF